MSTCTGTSDENEASSHNLAPVHQCEKKNVLMSLTNKKIKKMSRPNYLPVTATCGYTEEGLKYIIIFYRCIYEKSKEQFVYLFILIN